MKNKILFLLLLLPAILMAQNPHHSGYTDWLEKNASPDHEQFSRNTAGAGIRDVTYFISGIRLDTFDIPSSAFNVVDSSQYLYSLDSSLVAYVQLIHDVDSGWINYLANFYFYDAQHNVDTAMLSFWDDTNLQWLAQQLTLNTFDANNNLLTSTLSIWDTNYWKNASQVLYAYDSAFHLIQQTQLSWNGASWDTSSKFVFTYDVNNNRIQEIDYEGGAPTYKYATSYDSANYEIQNIQQSWNGNTWKNVWKDALSYDANHNVILYERRDWHSGSFSLTDTKYAYSYNGLNDLIARVDSNGDGASSYFPAYNYSYSYNVNNDLSYQLQQRYNNIISSFDNAEQLFYYYTTIISGMNSLNAGNAFHCNLYPNPSTESLEITIHTANISNIELRVMSMNGQIISSRSCSLKAGDNFLNIDVSKLPAGIYAAVFLNPETKEQSVTRFVKE